MSNLLGKIFYSCASLGYNFGTKSVFHLHVIILPYSICAKLCGVEQNTVYLSSKYWVLFEPQTPYGLPLKRLKTWLDVDLLKNLHISGKMHQQTCKLYQITLLLTVEMFSIFGWEIIVQISAFADQWLSGLQLLLRAATFWPFGVCCKLFGFSRRKHKSWDWELWEGRDRRLTQRRLAQTH